MKKPFAWYINALYICTVSSEGDTVHIGYTASYEVYILTIRANPSLGADCFFIPTPNLSV